MTAARAIDDIDKHCVIQNFGMRLVGAVWMFQPTVKGEIGRRKFLSTRENPYFYAKAEGLRIYVTLAGSLRYIGPEDTAANKDEIHAILQEMAEHYASSITEGMRRQSADRAIEIPEGAEED